MMASIQLEPHSQIPATNFHALDPTKEYAFKLLKFLLFTPTPLQKIIVL